VTVKSPAELTKEEWHKMAKKVLVLQCMNLHLTSTGTQAALAERLYGYFNGGPAFTSTSSSSTSTTNHQVHSPPFLQGPLPIPLPPNSMDSQIRSMVNIYFQECVSRQRAAENLPQGSNNQAFHGSAGVIASTAASNVHFNLQPRAPIPATYSQPPRVPSSSTSSSDTNYMSPPGNVFSQSGFSQFALPPIPEYVPSSSTYPSVPPMLRQPTPPNNSLYSLAGVRDEQRHEASDNLPRNMIPQNQEIQYAEYMNPNTQGPSSRLPPIPRTCMQQIRNKVMRIYFN